MTFAASLQPRFHYQVESVAVARGGRSWSVFEERAHGMRSVIASGTVYPQAGESWNHETLVSLIQSVKSLRGVAGDALLPAKGPHPGRLM